MRRSRTDIGIRRIGCLGILLLYMAAYVTVALLLFGCTRTVYMPVETVRTEREEVTRRRTDTVMQGDTRLIYIKGDTVVDWRDRWRDRTTLVHDTVCIERTDSVQAPYPVERKLSRWERVKMDFGGIAIGGALVALAAVIIWIVKLIRRKI